MEPLVALGLILTALAGLGVLGLGVILYRFVTAVLEDQRQFSKDVLNKVLLYQRADSAEEAVMLDVNAEALRDAIAKAEAEEKETERELTPQFVNTDDGRQIDLRDWEPL